MEMEDLLIIVTLLVVIVIQLFPATLNVIAFRLIGGIATYVATKVMVTLVSDK